jgi:manganese/zinc/iron transport system permease protein
LKTLGLALYLFLLFPLINMEAAQVNDEVNLISKTVRFFSFSDYSVQVVVMGVIFMGVGCGLMGGFVVTRKLSLFGDTLSHAVLPGVAVGFLWSQSKNSISIIVGCHDRGLSWSFFNFLT